MLWYHDHAMGTSRLNLYAGLMGVYLLRDEQEARLKLPAGRFELPLVLYDRIFDHEGQLYYPVSPDPEHPWTDEVAGDAMVVNGRVQPFCEVEPRRYRLRVLNAANARFFRLGLSDGSQFLQIGADQGLLPGPVRLTSLLLAPGERADLIVDFAARRGERILLTNGAFQMMQFRVGSTPMPDSSQVPGTLRPLVSLPETRGTKASDDSERVQGACRQPNGHVAQPDAMAHAGDRDVEARLLRDLVPGQSHRRYPPHSSPPRTLPGNGSPVIRSRRLPAAKRYAALCRGCSWAESQ